MPRDAGEIGVSPPALQSGHGRTGIGRSLGQFHAVLGRHGQGNLDVLEHVFERKTRIEIRRDHARHLEVHQRRVNRMELKGFPHLVERNAAFLQKAQGLGVRSDRNGYNEVGGNLHGGGLADVTHWQNGFGSDFQLGTDSFQHGGVPADVINNLSGGGGVTAPGEGGVKKRGVPLLHNAGGFQRFLGRGGGMVQYHMLGTEGGCHGLDGLNQGRTIRHVDLDNLGRLRDLGRRGKEVRFRAGRAVPDPDLITGLAQVGGDTAADEAEANDAGVGFRRSRHAA